MWQDDEKKPYNLHTNKDDVDAKSESRSKFDADDDIEEYNSDYDNTTDKNAWPVELWQNNNIGRVDHGMNSNEAWTHFLWK